MKHFEKIMMGMYSGWSKAHKNAELEKVYNHKKAYHFWEKNCDDIIPQQFPDIDQMAKIPWHFFKIPWQFPDLEKILFFPDFSLTRGNPVLSLNKNCFFSDEWMNE